MNLRTLFLGLVVLTLAACGGREQGDRGSGNEKAVRVYDVPSGQLQSVQTALREVLGQDKAGAVSTSNGQLVVIAPASTQESIRDAIARLSGQAAAGGVVAPVRLRFWLVHARASGNQRDPRLEPVAHVVDEAVRSQGLGSLSLEGYADFSTMPGTFFDNSSGELQVRGQVDPGADGIMLKTTIDGPGHIESAIRLRAGQYVLLTSNADDGDGARLIVVQAQPLAKGG